MKATREQLLTISNLELSGTIYKMDDVKFDEFGKSLDGFVENFPDKESQLKSSFEARDIDAFSKTILTLLDMLTKIHANSMAQKSFRLLSEVRAGKYDTAEAHLTDFLSSISALSIDIQMAQYKDTDSADGPGGVEGEQEVAKTILGVDDVSFLLTMLKTALQNTSYKFTGVTSGELALRFLDNHQADLFILDIEMPDMNGYELAKKIRERGHTAPIIFLTGNSTKEYVMRAIQAGAADFIVKPVNKEDVLEKIKKYIG